MASPERVYRADWIGNHYAEGVNIWSGPSTEYVRADLLADALDREARLRAMLDKAELDREAAGVLGATCAEVALMLAKAGLTPCVGADSDGEYVLGPFRDAQGQYYNGAGSVFWDDEGKRYAWSCYIELPGGVLKGVFNDNELPPDLAAMLARAALEETND